MTKKSDEQYIYLSRIKYDVLKFISEFISKNSYSPTQLEISKKLDSVELGLVKLFQS